MSYVLDASCLIYLGKVKVLEKLKNLKEEKFISPSVFEEAVKRGVERREPEAKYIEELIKNKQFLIKKPKTLIGEIPALTEADREVISLAKETNSTVIIDDERARIVAEFYNLEYHGTLYLIFLLVRKKVLGKKEAIRYIDEMIKQGFYLSNEKYSEIWGRINGM